MKAKSFVAELSTDGGKSYASNNWRFATEAEALAHAKEIACRWMAVTDWRAAQNDGEPNAGLDQYDRPVEIKHTNPTIQQLSTHTNSMATTEIPAELKAATDSLLDLVSAHVSTAIFQRVQAFVMEKSGSKLQAFLSDSNRSIEDRAALVTELTDILRKQEFHRLPNLASGQAAPTKQPATLTPAPAPALTPAPKAEPAPAPKTNGSAVNPKFAGETFSVPTNGIACTETPTAVPPPADPMAALTAALKAFMPPPPAAPQIDEAQVRRIVRTELATILESVAADLRK